MKATAEYAKEDCVWKISLEAMNQAMKIGGQCINI